jgi:hypothetical protein
VTPEQVELEPWAPPLEVPRGKGTTWQRASPE